MRERPEVERTKLAGGVPLDKEQLDLLESVAGTVLDIYGGIGRVAEYLSNKGCIVTLLEPERLAFSYRKLIVPDSKVKEWNIEPNLLKLNTPVYDYTIIRGLEFYEFAKKITKIGIVNLDALEIENVVPDTKVPDAEPKAERVSEYESGDKLGDIQSPD